MAEDYHTWSPYAFSGNRVVDARELEGLEPKKVNEVSLPDDPVEFAEMIGGGINSVRAAVANSVARTVNVFTNDAVRNKYVVDDDGGLTFTDPAFLHKFKFYSLSQFSFFHTLFFHRKVINTKLLYTIQIIS